MQNDPDFENDPDFPHLHALEDTVRLRLSEVGIGTRASWLFDRPDIGIRNGSALQLMGSEIVYRVTDPETVLIVLYRRRADARRALSNSFAGIACFLELLRRGVPAIRYVSALVDVFPYAGEAGITSERLVKVGLRFGGRLRSVDGERWLHLDVDTLVPLLGAGGRHALERRLRLATAARLALPTTGKGREHAYSGGPRSGTAAPPDDVPTRSVTRRPYRSPLISTSSP